jgi:hypothetical protein
MNPRGAAWLDGVPPSRLVNSPPKERSNIMTEKNSEAPNSNLSRTLTDDQIVTEKKVQRRSFLSATGIVLAGAAAIVSGVRATAGGLNADDKPRSDPDKPADKKHDDRDKGDRKRDDRDRDKRPDDRDKRPVDPDKRKPGDPSQR